MDEQNISWNQITCRSIMCVHICILAIRFRLILLGHWIMTLKGVSLWACVISTLSSPWNISLSSLWGYGFYYHVSEYSPERSPSCESTMSAYFPVCRREYPTTREHQTFLAFLGSESLLNPKSSDLMFLTGTSFSVQHFRIRQPSGSLFRHWSTLSIPCNPSRLQTFSTF